MIILNMSSRPLHRRTLEEIYKEILDNMKTTGFYDDIRVKLIDPIWTDPSFKNVVERFEQECENYCNQVDLNQSRNNLRNNLAKKFEETTSASSRMVQRFIDRVLIEHSRDIKSNYYQKAEDYVTKKFLPKPQSPIEKPDDSNAKSSGSEHDMDMDMDMEIDTGSLIDEDDAEDADDADAILAPPFSPIGNGPSDSELLDSNGKDEPCDKKYTPPDQSQQTSLDDIPIPPEVSPLTGEDEPQIKDENSMSQNENTPQLPDDDSDDYDRLTFSSVSSVRTGDLNDFTDEIHLSDDEESVLHQLTGTRAKTIKASELQSCEKINGHLNELVTNQVHIKQERVEMIDTKQPVQPQLQDASQSTTNPGSVDTGESDGTGSETTTSSRRLTRTRKSNSRYSGDYVSG